ncbi:MAG: ABC transporter permease subunit [Spirochaetota bacterium]
MKNKKNLFELIARDWQLLTIILLPALYFIIFHYVPMYGLIIAFKDYRIGKGIIGSEWVGIEWFKEFFKSFYFVRLIRNTFLLSVYNIIFSLPVPIIFALGLDEIDRAWIKKTSQTLSYAPYFISTVVLVGIMYNFLSVHDGVVNVILAKFGFKKINFWSSPKWFRPLYIGSGIWQIFGINSILYIAVLSTIDPQLYEALAIDGGNKWHKVRYIKLPAIKNIFIILMILSLGQILSVGYEKVILMYSPSTYETSDIISTYIYRSGILDARFSYGAAVGFFNSVINFFVVIIFNFIARKTQETSLW